VFGCRLYGGFSDELQVAGFGASSEMVSNSNTYHSRNEACEASSCSFSTDGDDEILYLISLKPAPLVN
jgi:hypothetical protein